MVQEYEVFKKIPGIYPWIRFEITSEKAAIMPASIPPETLAEFHTKVHSGVPAIFLRIFFFQKIFQHFLQRYLLDFSPDANISLSTVSEIYLRNFHNTTQDIVWIPQGLF